MQQYARDARKEYTELGTKDLSELKTFVKGLPKLLLLDRLSDIASPVAEVVKQQAFHDRLKMEQDMIDNFEVEDSVNFIQVWTGMHESLCCALWLLLIPPCSGYRGVQYV